MATQILGKVAYTSRGAYDSSFSYEINDVVTYKGSSYVSKKETKGNLPTNEEYWMLLAEKGATYQVTEEDLNNIANEITADANGVFNQNVTSKTNAFDANATSQTSAFNENAEKSITAFDNNANAKTTSYNNNATSALSAYDKNHNEKVDAYNTNANTKLEEFNTNASSYDERITDNTNRTKRIENTLYDSGEASGSSINIKDSTLAEFQEISVDGVCKQVTSTGKNEFDVSKLPMTLGGVTLSVDKDGNVVLNGTPTITSDYINFIVSQEIEFEPNTYTMSVENKKAGIGTAITGFEGKLNLTLSETGNSKTYTSTEKYTSTLQINVRYDVGTLNNFILNPQLEIGETKTKYEMFTGNQPSPSPSYPQPIEVIDKDFEVKSCGKNELNYVASKPSEGITPILNEDGSITCKGTQTQDYFSITQSIVSEIPKGIHTFSIDKTINTNCILRLSKADGSRDEHTIYTGQRKVTFEAKERYVKLYIYCYLRDSIGQEVDFTVKLQIEKGDKATPFEPYQETRVPINLPDGEFIGKINENAKDQVRFAFNEEDGQYHAILEKNIGKVVLDGSESWVLATTKDITQVFQKGEILPQKPFPAYVCDRFIYNNQGDVPTLKSAGAYGENTYIAIEKTKASTVDEFNQWLSENNTTVYYELAEPYEVDLGVVDMPLSYSPETNVFTTSELEALINAKYYRNFINTIQNLQVNEKALQQELIDIQNQLKALQVNVSNLSVLATNDEVESEVI